MYQKQIRHTAIDFYPRPPGGGRLDSVEFVNNVTCISIHALRVEGDVAIMPKYNMLYTQISIHALRVEGDKGITKNRLIT